MTGTTILLQFTTISRTPTEAAAALTAGCLPCELAALAAADQETAEIVGSNVTWSGVIGVEDQMTGDGRIIMPNALRWDTLPIPLRWVDEDTGGHQNAVVVGRILTIERQAGGLIYATGDFDMGHDAGREAVRRVDAGTQQGISMDLDDVSFEIRVAADLMKPLPEGDEIDDMPTDDNGRVTVVSMKSDDEVMATTDARVRAATIVGIPAFEPARIALDAPLSSIEVESMVAAIDDTDNVVSLVAGGIPVAPPREWFDDPQLSEPTRITITADGRIYGHVAIWGTCHTGYPGQCVTPPPSNRDYADFRNGTVLCADGTLVATGRITMDTLHAGKTLSATAAAAHYENTGRGAADVAAGQDAHGIWIAGALRPTMSAEQIRVLRASPLSGDWRDIAGSLEMIGVLAVNIPGFPIPRPVGLVAAGRMTSLVAAGMLPPTLIRQPGTPGALSADDLRWLKRLADNARTQQESADTEAAALRARVEAMTLARRVAAVRSAV